MSERKDIIVFRNVSKVYQIGDSIVRALDRAYIRIREGEFVSIIGPSGSGKSTMMNIIGCLDVADYGQYLLNGQPIESYTEKELSRIRSEQIGFIFQNFNLIGTLTTEENVELPMIYQRVPRSVRRERVEEALRRVDLWERRDHKPSELSGGQQQRVAIARAIATKPSLFLADEPTGNLDSKTGKEIMDLFHELHRAGNTIVLITHDPDVAAQAERRIHILDGKVTEEPYREPAQPAESAAERPAQAAEPTADSAEQERMPVQQPEAEQPEPDPAAGEVSEGSAAETTEVKQPDPAAGEEAME